MRVLKKFTKPVKRLPKLLLRLPRKLLRVCKKLWALLVSVAATLKIYPLDTVSGKLFAALEVLLVGNVVVGFLYVFGRWQGWPRTVLASELAAPRSLIALGIGFGAFAVAYPLDRRGSIEGFLVKTGLRQHLRLFTGPIVVVVSIVLAVLMTYLVANPMTLPFLVSRVVEDFVYAGPTGWSFWTRRRQWTTLILVFLCLFAITAIVLYWVLESYNTAAIRTDLAIVETTEEQDEMTGLVVRNDTNTEVSLEKAKVRDSTGESYTLSHGPSFRPGEIGTISIPANFTLHQTEYEVPWGFTFFYDRKKQARIFTRAGDTFIIDLEQSA